ncbi:MAG TPA: hypothetical protein ENK85_00980 [Saprospiraceae bacterium]|nr:hypothetical protein [Saprospiraceae bacterium]
MIQFYSLDYKKAWNSIKTTLKNKRFDSLSEVNKETWYIYNAYISFVQLIGKVELSPREKGALKQFRLSKFVNEVPVFSRDKQGMNISILIIQVLILLYEEKYDDLDHKIEALMKYKKRKLSNISLRTGYFIKIIQCLKRGNYSKTKVIHKATPYFEKLENIELDLSNQGIEFEVIPYPILWGYVQEILTE